MVYQINRAIISVVLLFLATSGSAQTTASNAKLGQSYVAQAKIWRDKKDSTKAVAYLRRAKQAFLSDSLFRDAAEVTLNMEEFYQYFGGSDMNVRIAYYEQALPLFQRSTAKHRQEATLKVLGDFYQVQGDYPKSLEYLLQALKLQKYAKPVDIESLYDLVGTVYARLGNLNKGLEYGLLAVKISEQLKDTTMQACAIYNRVGMTYFQMKQMPDAKRYYEKALGVAKKLKDDETQVGLYVNMAQVLIQSLKLDDCINMLNGVTKKFPVAAAAQHLGIDYSLLNCYTRLKRFKEAKFYAARLEEASLTINPLDNNQQLVQALLSNYYIATGQGSIARQHLSRMKKIEAVQHNPYGMATAYELEAKLDSTENKFADAYRNYLIAGRLKDSIWNEKQSRQVAQLHVQFETEKKDQELKVKEDRIQLLSNQARLQRVNLEQEKTTQQLITGSAILLIILLALSYKAYRSKNKANHQLQRQRQEIDQKNESLTRLVQQKDSLLSEKEWLMKEIHHRVKNNLQIVISLLSAQSKYLDNDVAYNAIRESQHRMQSISLIHQKLYQSDNLALVDISAYITELVDYLRESFDTDTHIMFEMDITPIELDVTRAVPLGLILNEAITNAIKYAFPDNRAGKIDISLKSNGENSFTLIIHDNGVGLPVAVDINKSKSLGMSLMRGLSKQLNGSLTINSNQGITITIDFVRENLLKAV